MPFFYMPASMPMRYFSPYGHAHHREIHSMPCRRSPSCADGFLLALLACALLPLVAPVIAIAFSLLAIAFRIGLCVLVFNSFASLACNVASSLDNVCETDTTCAQRCAFAKIVACAKKAACSRPKAEACSRATTEACLQTSQASQAMGIHPGVTCDRSGMSPIVGIRYHLRGHDWDLCQAEFDKCAASEKALYTPIPPPVVRSPSTTVRAEMATRHERTKTRGETIKTPAATAPTPPPNKPSVVRRDLSSVRVLQKGEDELRISIAVPGVRSEDLDVSVLGNSLTVKGATTRGGESYRVDRSVTFHEDVDVASAQATHADGMLTLVLKKKEGKRIPVLLARTDESTKEEEEVDEEATVKTAEAEQAAAGLDAAKDEAVAATEEAPPEQLEAEASSADEWVPLPNAE